MAKRIMCYLKDEDLEKLGDISGADLVGLALSGIDNSIKKELAFIKELLIGMQPNLYVNTPSPYNPATLATQVPIKSGFSNEPINTGTRKLSEKQLVMADGIIKTLLDEVTNEGFNNGDHYTHRFESTYTWLKGEARDYVRESVKEAIDSMGDKLDFTQFIWN